MPIGVIVLAFAVALGGLLGTLFGHKLSQDFKDKLSLVFGCCAMVMGIPSIILMENMPAVVFSTILGTALGLALHLGRGIERGAALLQKGMSRVLPGSSPSDEDTATLVTAIVLFCASGSGIYGALISGMTGDHSLLIAKSVLDLFTALIFACDLGLVISVIAIPQVIIYLVLFFCAGLILPLTTSAMINDFKACGGLIMLATGFRMVKLKSFPTADMIPAMVLVMPLSWLWSTYLLPLLS